MSQNEWLWANQPLYQKPESELYNILDFLDGREDELSFRWNIMVKEELLKRYTTGVHDPEPLQPAPDVSGTPEQVREALLWLVAVLEGEGQGCWFCGSTTSMTAKPGFRLVHLPHCPLSQPVIVNVFAAPEA